MSKTRGIEELPGNSALGGSNKDDDPQNVNGKGKDLGLIVSIIH